MSFLPRADHARLPILKPKSCSFGLRLGTDFDLAKQVFCVIRAFLSALILIAFIAGAKIFSGTDANTLLA
jgi:hypothetical protein